MRELKFAEEQAVDLSALRLPAGLRSSSMVGSIRQYRDRDLRVAPHLERKTSGVQAVGGECDGAEMNDARVAALAELIKQYLPPGHPDTMAAAKTLIE